MTLGDARIEYVPDGLIYEVDVLMDQIDIAAGTSK